MLLKISLALAILVGLATLYFTHFQVGGKIQTLTSERDEAQSAKKAADEARAKAADEAKKTKAALEIVSKDLNTATNDLVTVRKDLGDQMKRASNLARDLETATLERNEARQELNKWQVIGLPPERIISELAAKKDLEKERGVLKEENRVFTERVNFLTKRLRRYEPAADPEVPPGTKGKVVAYDPKYEFVVLDIGADQGLKEDAKMLINREGKLIAKVKITHVEKNRAIANIMPEWKQDDVVEGDQAVSLN
jgi:hypothetical protein